MSKQTIECATLCGTTQLSHDFTAVRPADEQDYFLVNFSSRKCAQKSNPERSLHPFFFSLPLVSQFKEFSLSHQMMRF
jgi:hypothetical protein